MKVSALIPTYNRRPYMSRAIDSVLAQTVPVHEIIVVDDGSTDGTSEAIRSRYGSRVAVFRQGNGGVSVARRRAVEEAQGEWVAFLDSDDEWLPGRNALLLDAASALPKTVAWIFGDAEFLTDKGGGGTVFGESGLVIDRGPRVFQDPLSGLPWHYDRPRVCQLQSSLIRKSALIELDCFAEGLRSAEDFLAGLQVATSYWFAAIPPVVTRIYRTSDLRETSLERNAWSSGDHYRAGMLGYALAAQRAGPQPWGTLHSESVRRLCRTLAHNGHSIRRLALDQFKFGVSARSVMFFGAAMLGSGFFRAGAAAKRKLTRVQRWKKRPRDTVKRNG